MNAAERQRRYPPPVVPSPRGRCLRVVSAVLAPALAPALALALALALATARTPFLALHLLDFLRFLLQIPQARHEAALLLDERKSKSQK